MTEECTTHTTDTHPAGATADCPSWCEVDHDSGKVACVSGRRRVVDIVTAPEVGTTSVHMFRAGPTSDVMLRMHGQSYSLDAAKALAHKILDLVEEGTPASQSALQALAIMATAMGTTLEELAVEGEVNLGQMTEADVSFLARLAGKRLAASA